MQNLNNGVPGGIKKVKGIREVLGSEKIEFYPSLDKIDKISLSGNNFEIRDAKFISDWDDNFGTHSFYLVKVYVPELGTEYTSIFSGVAVLKQLRKLVDFRRLPVACSLKTVRAGSGNEYYVLDDPIPEEVKTQP